MPSRPALAVLAGLLFALTFWLLYAVNDTRAGVAALFAVPITVSALTFGRRGGIIGASISVVLTVLWLVTSDTHLGAFGWISRLVPFFVIGVAIGIYEDRTRRSERHRLDERYAGELHDRVVQSLVLATYALQKPGSDPTAREAVEEALAAAKDIISSRMDAVAPGDLRLDGPPSEAPPRTARRSL